MKLMPRSMALRTMRNASGSSTYFRPRCHPPRPTRDTFSPVLPSVRYGISECDVSVIAAPGEYSIGLDAMESRYSAPGQPCSFADAEASEDQVQNIVRGRCPGDFVQLAQRAIKVEQDHLVGYLSSR